MLVRASFGLKCLPVDALGYLSCVTLLAYACGGPAHDLVDAQATAEIDSTADVSLPIESDASVQEPAPQVVAIFLVPGFNSTPGGTWSFYRVEEELRAAGFTVGTANLPPYDRSSNRARVLQTEFDAFLNANQLTKAHLVCYSQGGIDCRYLASPAGLNEAVKIVSVTTIGSPHRGTPVAEWTLRLLPIRFTLPRATLDALASLYGGSFSDMADDARFVAAIESLTPSSMSSFNERIVDAPGVFYQSFAGMSGVSRAGMVGAECSVTEIGFRWSGDADALDATFSLVFPIATDGGSKLADGIIPVSSARWGRFRGCLPADHLDLIGQVADDVADRRTGFDHISFYRELIHLAL